MPFDLPVMLVILYPKEIPTDVCKTLASKNFYHRIVYHGKKWKDWNIWQWGMDYWARLACECPAVSRGGVGQQWPAMGSEAPRTTVLVAAAWWQKSFWKRWPLPLPYLGHRPKDREGTQPYPSIEDWIKYLWNMAPPIRERLWFPHGESLPWGRFHKLLILMCQRTDRMKTTVTEN